MAAHRNQQENEAAAEAAAADASKALSECLFSQYSFTVAGVASGTGYALYKKPKNVNGVGIMLVAGAVGTLGDLTYGYAAACKTHVKAWESAHAELNRLKEQREKATKKNDDEQ